MSSVTLETNLIHQKLTRPQSLALYDGNGLGF
jgi:hypothetical protein